MEAQEYFAPKTRDCVFVGWHRKAGGKISDRAYFWPLEAITHDAVKLPPLIDTVDYESPPSNKIVFPLFEAREKALEAKCVDYQLSLIHI